MQIRGFIGTTLIDFPGRVAAAVFTGGCNFRCPFCHNPSMVEPETPAPKEIPRNTVLSKLEQRSGFLDGVVISGGEPLIHPDLPGLLREFHALGLAVKLDTNGSLPDRLQQVMEAGLLDYISMDVKAVDRNYARAAGVSVDLKRLHDSIERIIHSGIEHEFRTTMVPGIVSPENIPELAARLVGAQRFVLQQFRPDVTLDPKMKAVVPFPDDVLRAAARNARQWIERVEVRAG